jgi:hypothetical protein
MTAVTCWILITAAYIIGCLVTILCYETAGTTIWPRSTDETPDEPSQKPTRRKRRGTAILLDEMDEAYAPTMGAQTASVLTRRDDWTLNEQCRCSPRRWNLGHCFWHGWRSMT